MYATEGRGTAIPTYTRRTWSFSTKSACGKEGRVRFLAAPELRQTAHECIDEKRGGLHHKQEPLLGEHGFPETRSLGRAV